MKTLARRPAKLPAKKTTPPSAARAAGRQAQPGTKAITKAASKPASKPVGKAAAVPPPVAIGPRLRHARLVKGLLIKDLAERLGVSISLISKYENDKLLPPLTVLHALVNELETNIGALFEPDWSGSGYIARDGARPCIKAAGDGASGGVTLERIVPNGQGHLLQGNIHIVAPGGGSMGPMRHEGDEVGYVLCGQLELGIDGTVYTLGPGDSFAFPSNLAHTYRNPGAEVTRVVWINTPPTF